MTEKTNKSSGFGYKMPIFLVIYSVLLLTATVTMTETSGIAHTLPFIFVLPAVATLFYNKKFFAVMMCFVLTLFFRIIEANSLTDSLITAVIAFIFASAGIIVKRLFITAHVNAEKRAFCLTAGIMICVVGIVGHALIYGDPFSAMAAKSENTTYISETYGENAPEIGHTHFDTKSRRYFTNVSFTDEAVMNADISAKDSDIIDGYSNYYEFVLLSERRDILQSVLGSAFIVDAPAVRINVSETSAASSPDTAADDIADMMVFDIAFTTMVADETAFAAKCDEYIKYITDIGFEYRHINFYGGIAEEYKYKLTYGGEATTISSDLVVPFDDKNFDLYRDDLDYADRWSYGS